MGLVVMKFGGTSVADTEKISRAAGRAIQKKLAGDQVVMVVSAMGKTTDKLVGMAREITPSPPKRELDMLLTTGEQVSISLMAMAIYAQGQEAISLTGGQIGLVTDAVHTKARIHNIDTSRIREELSRGRIVIVAGFQGIDRTGEITTLGRGASDTTAVALAAVLEASHCEIYTDVDGVFTSDPRIVEEARKIERISYDEMLELASLGAGVMHSRAIEFAKNYNVEIHVRSSFNEKPGTWITREVEQMEQIVVSGATVKEDLAQFVFVGLPNQPGVAASIFAHLAEADIVVDDIMQTFDDAGRASCSFTVEQCDMDECHQVAKEMAKKFEMKEVICTEQVAKVSVVGVGMRSHTGVAGKMFRALAEAKVNINAITTSEIKISCIIDPSQAKTALRVVHAAFELDKTPAETKR